uniref:Uncharacterized protein n=1 Tax=Anopheles funestus TaxID=62324 RepID=A0A182S256_ANOFN
MSCCTSCWRSCFYRGHRGFDHSSQKALVLKKSRHYIIHCKTTPRNQKAFHFADQFPSMCGDVHTYARDH